MLEVAPAPGVRHAPQPLLVALMPRADTAYPASPPAAQPVERRITIPFNNVLHRPGLTPDWGFSCVVESMEKTILFDTGAGAWHEDYARGLVRVEDFTPSDDQRCLGIRAMHCFPSVRWRLFMRRNQQDRP